MCVNRPASAPVACAISAARPSRRPGCSSTILAESNQATLWSPRGGSHPESARLDKHLHHRYASFRRLACHLAGRERWDSPDRGLCCRGPTRFIPQQISAVPRRTRQVLAQQPRGDRAHQRLCSRQCGDVAMYSETPLWARTPRQEEDARVPPDLRMTGPVLLQHEPVQDTPNAKRSRQLAGDVFEVGHALALGVYP